MFFINVNYDFHEWEKSMRRAAGATPSPDVNGRAVDFDHLG
jgi:hypothetical protein